MRAVTGEVVSSKAVSRVPGQGCAGVHPLRRLRGIGASGLPSEAGALVLSAAEAAAELHVFRRNAGAGESSEMRRKKRKRSDTEV